MAGWDDVSTAEAGPPPDSWDSVSTPLEPPRLPDVSGLQKTVQSNIQAQRKPDEPRPPRPDFPKDLDTGMGMNVTGIIGNPDSQVDLSPEMRRHLTKSYSDGSATDVVDYMQTGIPAAAISASPLGVLASPTLVSFLKTFGKATAESFAEQSRPENVMADYEAVTGNKPIAQKGGIHPLDSLEEAAVEGVALPAWYGLQAGLTGAEEAINKTAQPLSALSEYVGEKTGYMVGGPAPQIGTSLIQDVPMAFGGGFMPLSEFMGIPRAAKMVMPAELNELVGSRLGKSAATVTHDDVVQAISTGFKDKDIPKAQDFESVATVMGDAADTKTLHVIYNETGVKPDQVLIDARHDPQVAQDVAAGKIPEAYEAMAAPKPEMLPKQAEKLSIARSDTAKSFDVIDEQGDHVHGGFDSYEEAQHYIEDEAFRAEERAAIEAEEVESGSRIATEQDVFTHETAKATLEGEPKAAPFDDVKAKVDAMSTEMRDTRLNSLNKKMEAGIITPREMAEREEISAKTREARDVQIKLTHKEEKSRLDKVAYDILGSKGEPVGYFQGKILREGRQLHIDEIYHEGEAHSLGAKNVKSLIEQLQKEYPNLEQITGDRMTGSRLKAGADSEKVISADVKVKKKPDQANPSANQFVLPGAEKISDKELAERTMDKPLQAGVEQKPANEGIFDVAGRGQADLLDAAPVKAKPKGTIPASEIGKPTSLRTFLSNNGAKFNENNELVSIKRDGVRVTGEAALEHADEIAKEHGYVPKDDPNAPSQSVNQLQNLLTEKNGGRDAWREQDADRVARAEENRQAKQWQDPAYIEHEAHNAGIDTERVAGETEKQYTARLVKALTDFYESESGASPVNFLRRVVGDTIILAEKAAGKLSGGVFQKLAEGYIKTFQPELVGPLAKRADAYLAKFKTAMQEAENAYYRISAQTKKAFGKLTDDERMQWIYDHETGRWNSIDNPDHARQAAAYDALYETEKEAGVSQTNYKQNYLPHEYKDPEGVDKFFRSDAMIKKHGANWFTKASRFQLVQEAYRAGFKLKDNNPEAMLVSRQLASDNMLRTMDLLRDMEGSGIATRSRAFSVDKRIAKTQAAIDELQQKYKKEFDKKNDPKQTVMAGIPPAASKKMELVQKRLDTLKSRLDDLAQERADNKLSPEQMKELKGGFRVIGPDNKAWNIHQQAGPVWKNAMDSKGLWENQGVLGDAYRTYTAAKAMWVQAKLGLSLFHPVHVAAINLASGAAAMADHLIQGGKISDLAFKDTGVAMGITGETFKGKDHSGVQAWNTAPEARTPEQQQIVTRMMEGGFKPTLSARDTVHFKENFDKAIKGVGLNNLRLLGTAISLPGLVMKPFFEHWIPGMKSEIYLRRYQQALDRDPTLATDAGRRSEIARQIAKDTDRTYGEMNNDVQFWNKNLRDSFNAAFISGGWKLAQIYNARGLLQPGKIAYKFAKTGEFSKADITYNMLHAYAYTGLTLALGGAINGMLGNPIGTAKDDVWDMVKNLVAPQTGDKNPDGTPIRLQQPAFAKEAYMLAHDINTEGLIGGTGHFLYHQTLIPGIVDTLNNRDFVGRELISDPTDLNQWTNAGWNSIMPISVSQMEKADSKHSDTAKTAGMLGFPVAGAYMNQSAFEQKVLHAYSKENPPKDDVYSAKLKSDLRSETASGNTDAAEKTRKKMREKGMSDHDIAAAEKVYTTPFIEHAWTKLSTAQQRELIESASEEEKKKFKIKSQ